MCTRQQRRRSISNVAYRWRYEFCAGAVWVGCTCHIRRRGVPCWARVMDVIPYVLTLGQTICLVGVPARGPVDIASFMQLGVRELWR